MKIYISHSTKYDFKNELYAPLKTARLVAQFILPHQESETLYPSKELFLSKGCDKVFAEVSYPSTGQGIELGWANSITIPIICIYKKGSKYSSSLQEVTQDFIEYNDSSDLIEKIKGII